MDVFKRIASKTPWAGRMSYLDKDWDVLPSSVLLCSRKFSRIFVIIFVLSISFLTLLLFQRADIGVQDATYVPNSNTSPQAPDSGYRPDAPAEEIVEDYFTGDIDKTEDGHIEDLFVEAPFDEQPAPQDAGEQEEVEEVPASDTPAVERPAIEESANGEPTGEDSIPEEPIVEELVNEGPVNEKPAVDEPTASELHEEEAAEYELPIDEEGATEEPTGDRVEEVAKPPVQEHEEGHVDGHVDESVGKPMEDHTQEVAKPSDHEHTEEHKDEHLNPPPGAQVPSNVVEEPTQNRKFVLVIPATEGGPDLCKTIFTALALGYPSPVIVNWKVDYHTVTGWNGGQNLPKIPGFVEYLDAAMHPSAHASEKLGEDDLVLLVDAYDIWFQLPAEVMLKRYHAINEKANARLREEWQREEPMPMRQTIVAGSGKNCHPQPTSGSDDHCERLPDSPLRADLYGPETEKNETKHRDHRPKYINGGLYMGPAGDIRRLFRRAMEKMKSGLGQGVHLFSEQGIPGEVLGEQEIWRQWRRKNTVDDADAMALMNRDFEYHFGLDYHQDLSVQTFWTDTDDGLFDGAFVRLNNQTDIDEHSAALGISPVRLKGLPEDVRGVHNPLSSVIEAPDWGEMPLYADFFTESVPAILHHNGFKERRISWWHKPWFHQRLRQLLTPSLAPADLTRPLATVSTQNGSFAYWAPLAEVTDRKPRLMAGSAKSRLARMEFQELCHDPEGVPGGSEKQWWEEVFRDNQGPLT